MAFESPFLGNIKVFRISWMLGYGFYEDRVLWKQWEGLRDYIESPGSFFPKDFIKKDATFGGLTQIG